MRILRPLCVIPTAMRTYMTPARTAARRDPNGISGERMNPQSASSKLVTPNTQNNAMTSRPSPQEAARSSPDELGSLAVIVSPEGLVLPCILPANIKRGVSGIFSLLHNLEEMGQ